MLFEQKAIHIVYLGDLDATLHCGPNVVTDSHYQLLEKILGSSEAAKASLTYSYRHGFNGFAASLRSEEAARISHKLHDGGKNAQSLYGDYESQSLRRKARYGDDIIIGMLDSGTWFATGHWTHTTSTAAGRFVENASWSGHYISDPIAIGSFHAMQRGIIAAGNEYFPGTETNAPPWIVTVAASTISRSFTSRISLGNNQSFAGLSLTSDGILFCRVWTLAFPTQALVQGPQPTFSSLIWWLLWQTIRNMVLSLITLESRSKTQHCSPPPLSTSVEATSIQTRLLTWASSTIGARLHGISVWIEAGKTKPQRNSKILGPVSRRDADLIKSRGWMTALKFSIFLLDNMIFEQKATHIVYLGDLDATLHSDPDAVTDSHYQLLENILGRYNFHSRRLQELLSSRFDMFRIPNVISVFPSQNHKMHTTNSWSFLGFDEDGGKNVQSLFGDSGSEPLRRKANYGEDIIVGVIDTGTWNMARVQELCGRFTCEQGENFTSSHCNRKLIGARFFEPEGRTNTEISSPRDANGHGTHAASTAGGQFVENVGWSGYASGTLSGGASNSRIAAYKVCWARQQAFDCTSESVLAAFEAGIHDGVDVFSVSLGTNSSGYFSDPIAIGSFHATQKGIVVVPAAGNNYSFGTVANAAPWIITVAASTISRRLEPDSLSAGDGIPLCRVWTLAFQTQALVQGTLMPSMNTFIIHLLHYSELERCVSGSLDPKKVRGKIVTCLDTLPLGGGARQAGIIFYNRGPQSARPFENALSASHVNRAAANAIKSSPVAQISAASTLLNAKSAPVTGAFSSQGPNPDILKPDITAPGVDILAAYSPFANNTEYRILSGTSMACPHVSGIVALLKAYRPEWCPVAINSAIVTTGFLTDNSGGPIKDAALLPVTPFNFGAGHVNPNAAAHPGLVYDAKAPDFTDFLCGLSQERRYISTFANCAIRRRMASNNLNYPSIAISSLRARESSTGE
ncbi:hypothetical protein SELMODRAFT_424299 [Selaginella moellendorffii]|uniref:Peptidase S8/S53 domain-containing protein n=1 Tax=Selaginella moellendorffii TaxID=88036 RepID=D8SPF7_SELML|nr:hypothetical protein SELMODRAFT_424299 [Selaginella moellendorffii]